jgi:diadenosine tetraphosphate (Ap4A) HIT family hydrolase
MPFVLHPQLAQDCFPVGDFPLCKLLLMNDQNHPWFILVPRREGISEIYELNELDQMQLWRESAQLGKALMQAYRGDKLNVAALGNQVPQLHLHHIVRHRNDPNWPFPPWGRLPAQRYSPIERNACLDRLKPHLKKNFA